MKFLPLVLANLKRHKLRTILTMCSVALALFLFASLRTVTTTLNAGSEVEQRVAHDHAELHRVRHPAADELCAATRSRCRT